MRQALDRIAELRRRAALVGVSGNREYNPGWHTALDLQNLLRSRRGDHPLGLERRESRGGALPRRLPRQGPGRATFNIVAHRGADGAMALEPRPIPPLPAELQAVIEEQAA